MSGPDLMIADLSYFSLLSRNPKCAKKARDEIIRELFEGKEPTLEELQENWRNVFTLENIGKLEYLSMCSKEQLRIDPPISLAPTVGKEDVNIGNYTLYKGDIAFVSLTAIHTDPKIWRDPHKFIPERFDPTSPYYLTPDGHKRHPYSYSPFGSSVRSCIGIKFTQSINMVVLAIFLLFTNIDELKEETETSDPFLQRFGLGFTIDIPWKFRFSI